ncbi:hypothetical protein D3C81_1865390 [compost metagenome]
MRAGTQGFPNVIRHLGGVPAELLLLRQALLQASGDHLGKHRMVSPHRQVECRLVEDQAGARAGKVQRGAEPLGVLGMVGGPLPGELGAQRQQWFHAAFADLRHGHHQAMFADMAHQGA